MTKKNAHKISNISILYATEKNMIYFHPIECKYEKEIQERTMYLLDTLGFNTMEAQPADWVLEHFPEIGLFLEEYNLIDSFDGMMLLSIKPNSRAVLHSDGYKERGRNLAINIPITNTANTAMNWFPDAKLVPKPDWHRVHSYYDVYERDLSVEPAGILELTSTHMVRVDVPHNVDNLTDNRRRILSLSFRPEPIDLWPEKTTFRFKTQRNFKEEFLKFNEI